MGNSGSSAPRPDRVETVETHLGPLRVSVFEHTHKQAQQQRTVLCIQGAAAQVDVIEEWFPAARALTEGASLEPTCSTMQVLIPDLHSNPKTAPGIFNGVSAR